MVLTSSASSLAGLVVAAAVLYLARDVLVPLALAILLSFLGKHHPEDPLGARAAAGHDRQGRRGDQGARELSDVKILVVLWTDEDTAKARARLGDAGVDEIVTSASGAIERLRQLAAPIGLAKRAAAVPA